MIFDEENFYDYVYRLFYNFSQTEPEHIGLSFSKKIIHPILQTKPDVEMTIPLPKKIGEDYVFEGLVFENSNDGRKSMWALFLATLYHLASHAAISDYSNYEEWQKNKTDELCWQVIDFIEDNRVQKFLERNDVNMWKNICEIESKFENLAIKKGEKHVNNNTNKSYRKNEDEKILDSIKTRILENSDENKKGLVDVADLLYHNRNLFQFSSFPNREQHAKKWFLKFEERSPFIESFGTLANQVIKLDELWQIEELAKTRLTKKYKKYMKNLHFDTIVIPPGNLQKFGKIKSKTLPMLRRIRQQIRMISNLTDDPKIDQIGYVDMQMAIQAIASEGQSNEIFERDELRRGEEAWAIIIDKSASMGMRFDHLKEFSVCISESANELTGKYDAWALYSFDNNFQILKDFKEKYNQEVQARIGSIETGGLTLLPDALELTSRILADDPRERKYIFVITDGRPSGYDRIHEAFSKVVKKTDVSDITLVAIGVTKLTARSFRNSARGRDLKTLVTKFISAYRTASSDM